MANDSSQNTPYNEASIMSLTRGTGLIFAGTVVELGNSTVASLPAQPDFVVIRVERGLRVEPVLGDLRDKLITMAPRQPGSLRVGQRVVFFTHSWIHGGGIAVQEVDHLSIDAADAVAAAVEQLPQEELTDRVRTAELVVLAHVESIEQLPRMSYERDAALWAAAHLQVERVLRGPAVTEAVVYFPTSVGPPWFDAPRFHVGQRGIFLLHQPLRKRWSEKALESGSLVALDPNDYQSEEALPEAEKAVARVEREGGRQ